MVGCFNNELCKGVLNPRSGWSWALQDVVVRLDEWISLYRTVDDRGVTKILLTPPVAPPSSTVTINSYSLNTPLKWSWSHSQ